MVFHRLGREELARIVEIQLASLSKRLERRELGVELTQAAKELIGELGWDPQYGARPLKRAIQRYVEDPLARRVLAGDFMPGDIIFIDRSADNELRFEKKVLH